jgi:hypothetical protein
MRVTMERAEKDGRRFVWLHSENNHASDPKVVREWIMMLELVAAWMEEKGE